MPQPDLADHAAESLLRDALRAVDPYQPVYGLPSLVPNPIRRTADRCEAIERAISPLSGRRILDLGCSLGYVALHFADRGALRVEGWDKHPENVRVADLTARTLGLPARFRAVDACVQEIEKIEPGEFDVLLMLSVLHHVVNRRGLGEARLMLAAAFARMDVLVLELAQKHESPDLPWTVAQPDEVGELFSLLPSSARREVIGEFSTGDGRALRPLVVIRCT